MELDAAGFQSQLRPQRPQDSDHWEDEMRARGQSFWHSEWVPLFLWMEKPRPRDGKRLSIWFSPHSLGVTGRALYLESRDASQGLASVLADCVVWSMDSPLGFSFLIC